MDAQLEDRFREISNIWADFRTNNDKARNADHSELKRLNDLLDEQTKQVDLIETALKRPGSGTGGDGEISEERKAFTNYCRRGDQAMHPEEIKVLTIGDDTAAGYLAPNEFLAEIIKGVTEISPVRTVARVKQTSRTALEIPKRTGQFAAVWVGEIESRSETTGLTFGLEEIPTHELTAEVYVSNKMVEDSVFDMERELQEEFTDRFALAEGTAFVDGDAVKRPEGFLTNADVASTNSGSAADISDANGQANGLIDLFYAIKSPYSRNGTWLLNRTTVGSARKLKDGNNQYIWAPGLSPGAPNMILGAPYVEATDMPVEAADAFPIAFGDWRRAYMIVDRISMSVLRDPFTRGSSGQIKFVARRRVGGQVVLAEAIRKLKCSV